MSDWVNYYHVDFIYITSLHGIQAKFNKAKLLILSSKPKFRKNIIFYPSNFFGGSCYIKTCQVLLLKHMLFAYMPMVILSCYIVPRIPATLLQFHQTPTPLHSQWHPRGLFWSWRVSSFQSQRYEL